MWTIVVPVCKDVVSMKLVQ